MELVTFGKELVQSAAEHAASYRAGQTVLRHLDRALWVIEKCARWAVPPPLDQDDQPQPELVRPLPWVFFLALLIFLRITRESISLINLVMGKPPLRSADVVMYIQSKRRYLRTLKYQGNRMMRARSSSAPPAHAPRAWHGRLHSLLEFTMCFRRSANYGNNNTTRVSNNDEVLVVKRSKRPRPAPGAAPAATTAPSAPSAPLVPLAPASDSMERLIERMMLDLDAESDDDSSYTLTNVTSVHSDQSDTADSDQETIKHQSPPKLGDSSGTEVSQSAHTNGTNSSVSENTTESPNTESPKPEVNTEADSPVPENTEADEINSLDRNNEDNDKKNDKQENSNEVHDPEESISPNKQMSMSPKEESSKFLESEKCSVEQKSQKKERKYVNGRIGRSSEKKKAGLNNERRESPAVKAKFSD